MKNNKPLLIILILALAIRVIFAVGWHELLWDSGVYIGMGKFVYSGGMSGLWEHIRPPLMPFILGGIWGVGLDPALFGRLIEILLMVGVVWLTYELTEHWWNKKTAIIASLIIALSPIFYYLSFHQYTEIPSVFFALLGLWLFTKKSYFFAGLSTGLAFLAKFPAGIFIAILLLVLLIQKKWKEFFITGMGFGVFAIPYLVWGWMVYGSPFATVIAAQDAISRALGCNVLMFKPWWQYGYWLVCSETLIHFAGILGIYALWNKWNKKHLLYALSLVLPILYFIQLHCRDYRYLTLFLPFVAMLTALGIMLIFEKINSKKKYLFTVVVIILAILMLNTSIKFYYGNELQEPNIVAENYFSYLKDKQIRGEIWIANPIVAAHTDAKLGKIYYPIFDEGLSRSFTEYVTLNSDQIGVVMLDNCGGGIICPPDEPKCPEQTNKLIEQLDENFNLVYNETYGRCWYKIWVTS